MTRGESASVAEVQTICNNKLTFFENYGVTTQTRMGEDGQFFAYLYGHLLYAALERMNIFTE